jgi:Fe-S-cluster containining protein
MIIEVKCLKKRKKRHTAKPVRFKTEPDILKKIRYVQPDDTFNFECSLCGECCRNAENSVMLEPFDLFRIARHFRRNGRPYCGIEDVIMEYTDIKTIDDTNYPIFLAKAKGQRKACVFLKDGRCSIQDAKPKACRLYPLGAWPNDALTEFVYFIASEKQHHFAGPAIRVSDWMAENFGEEEREVVLADARSIAAIAPLVRGLKELGVDREHILKPLILFKYILFETDEPFLPQVVRSTAQLMNILLGIAEDFGG